MPQLHPKGALEREPGRAVEAAQLIQPRSTEVEYAIGRFPHLHHAACVFVGGDKMQMGELGQGVPNRFVVSPLGDLAAVNVRDRYPGDQCRLRHREDLEAITEHHDDVRPQPLDGIGEPDRSQSHGLGDADRRVAREQHLDLGVDRESILLDRRQVSPNSGGKVHAGDDDLQLQRRDRPGSPSSANTADRSRRAIP